MQEVTILTPIENILPMLVPSSGTPPAREMIDRHWDRLERFDTSAITRTAVRSGRFSIERSYLKLPERKFIIQQADGIVCFETVPRDPWPHISFKAEVSENIDEAGSVLMVSSITSPILRPGSDTASAEIFTA